jgi:HTH-type transcriptional regulator / antitoxin HigA
MPPRTKGDETIMNVKIIKNKAEYAIAMARLSELMTLNPKRGSDAENELELLALVIENYEQKLVPPVIADPIEAILFRMDQMQLSRKDLVPFIGSESKISEVLNRKRPLSLPMIRALREGLNISAEILIEPAIYASGSSRKDARVSHARASML